MFNVVQCELINGRSVVLYIVIMMMSFSMRPRILDETKNCTYVYVWIALIMVNDYSHKCMRCKQCTCARWSLQTLLYHTHWAHDVVTTLNQRQWRWFNVATTSYLQWVSVCLRSAHYYTVSFPKRKTPPLTVWCGTDYPAKANEAFKLFAQFSMSAKFSFVSAAHDWFPRPSFVGIAHNVSPLDRETKLTDLVTKHQSKVHPSVRLNHSNQTLFYRPSLLLWSTKSRHRSFTQAAPWAYDGIRTATCRPKCWPSPGLTQRRSNVVCIHTHDAVAVLHQPCILTTLMLRLFLRLLGWVISGIPNANSLKSMARYSQWGLARILQMSLVRQCRDGYLGQSIFRIHIACHEKREGSNCSLVKWAATVFLTLHIHVVLRDNPAITTGSIRGTWTEPRDIMLIKRQYLLNCKVSGYCLLHGSMDILKTW